MSRKSHIFSDLLDRLRVARLKRLSEADEKRLRHVMKAAERATWRRLSPSDGSDAQRSSDTGDPGDGKGLSSA
jgi:hypothetical protein